MKAGIRSLIAVFVVITAWGTTTTMAAPKKPIHAEARVGDGKWKHNLTVHPGDIVTLRMFPQPYNGSFGYQVSVSQDSPKEGRQHRLYFVQTLVGRDSIVLSGEDDKPLGVHYMSGSAKLLIAGKAAKDTIDPDALFMLGGKNGLVLHNLPSEGKTEIQLQLKVE